MAMGNLCENVVQFNALERVRMTVAASGTCQRLAKETERDKDGVGQCALFASGDDGREGRRLHSVPPRRAYESRGRRTHVYGVKRTWKGGEMTKRVSGSEAPSPHGDGIDAEVIEGQRECRGVYDIHRKKKMLEVKMKGLVHVVFDKQTSKGRTHGRLASRPNDNDSEGDR
ncbi:hypothetical protein BC826DRAFT_1174980 [Russula brevipes]|nr:hypothetical protein BC826DRAFT_1174980 [Russula brevipes]